MREQTRMNQSWNGRTITIMPLSPTERARKIEGIVARRAFQISEARGFVSGHELEDWQLAESEIVSPLCGGFTEGSDGILLSTPASGFEKGVIEIGVEPRRLTLFGILRTAAEHHMHEGDHSNPQGHTIVHTLDLPVEINPSAITARFSHCMLEILLRKTSLAPTTAAGSKATQLIATDSR